GARSLSATPLGSGTAHEDYLTAAARVLDLDDTGSTPFPDPPVVSFSRLVIRESIQKGGSALRMVKADAPPHDPPPIGTSVLEVEIAIAGEWKPILLLPEFMLAALTKYLRGIVDFSDDAGILRGHLTVRIGGQELALPIEVGTKPGAERITITLTP